MAELPLNELLDKLSGELTGGDIPLDAEIIIGRAADEIASLTAQLARCREATVNIIVEERQRWDKSTGSADDALRSAISSALYECEKRIRALATGERQ